MTTDQAACLALVAFLVVATVIGIVGAATKDAGDQWDGFDF